MTQPKKMKLLPAIIFTETIGQVVLDTVSMFDELDKRYEFTTQERKEINELRAFAVRLKKGRI